MFAVIILYNFSFVRQIIRTQMCYHQATVRSSLKKRCIAGMYQLAWITSSRSNSGSSSSIPFSSRVFCMSSGRPRRFQMQLPPCLLNLRYLLRIYRMVSSAGTSRMVQWSLIMLMMRILLAFLVRRPMMFLESFHHFTSLSESTCRYFPVGQQNSLAPVSGLNLTLGSRLLVSNQQVMSVPAAWMRGVVRALAMFSWMMRVRLQTSPKRMTQQSLARLWLVTSSRVQQRCLGVCTGRNCFRLSFAGALIEVIQITNRFQIQSNMKINSTSKFIPNFLTAADDDFDNLPASPKPSPFRAIQNVLVKTPTKLVKKPRVQKMFLDEKEDEAQTTHSPLAKSPPKQCFPRQPQQTQVGTLGLLNGFRQSKMLLSAEIEESSSNSEEKREESPEGDCEDIVKLPAVRDIDKFQKRKSSESKQDHQEAVKIDNNKQVRPKQKNEIISVSHLALFETIKGGTTRCLMRRDKQSPSGFIEYNVYFQGSLQHILTVRKEGVWLYCIYLRHCLPDSAFFTYTKVATLQSNFLGSKYTLKKIKDKYSSATICYETNIFGLSGPRKFFAYLPKAPLPYEYLSDCFEDGKHRDKIEKCVSRTAKWNEKLQSYVLNFQGRASESSIKNFVLTDIEEREESNFVIFGKVGPDVYNLDIQSPFSLIQGVAVALTAFERKLTCD